MDKKIYWNLTGILFIIAAFFMGYLVYSNFDKGLVMNDEAYYLLHFRDFQKIVTIDATNYFRIFQIFYTDNIYHFRVITFALLNASSYLLFCTAANYFKLKIHPLLFGFLGICINMLTWQGTIVVLNQYHGNTILTNLTLSFVLFFLMYRKNLLLIPAGFFMGILLFNGIPHTITAVPVFIFILYHFWKKNRAAVYSFVGGGLLGIIIYFTLVQSPQSFISQLEYIKIYQEFHRKQHPKRFYIFWMAQVLGFIFLPLAVLIFSYRKWFTGQIKLLDKFLLAFGVILLLTSFFYYNLHLVFVFVGMLVFRYSLSDYSLEKKTFLAVLFFLPFGLAFGSGFYFHIRGGMYQIYYLLIVSIALIQLYRLRTYILYLAAFSISVIIYPRFLHDKGWKDFVYTQQNVPVKINGHTLYLDEKRKEDLDDLRPYLQNQPNVIYSKNNLTGYLYILNAHSPVPYYFTLKDYIKFMIEKQGKTPDDYIYIENDEYPFSVSDLRPMEFVKHPEKYKKVQAGRFTLYLPEKFVKRQ